MGSFLSDLKPGDHVVHEEHGIGRFERFVTKEVAGVVREYLELAFGERVEFYGDCCRRVGSSA